jgi:hypothetical protein
LTAPSHNSAHIGRPEAVYRNPQPTLSSVYRRSPFSLYCHSFFTSSLGWERETDDLNVEGGRNRLTAARHDITRSCLSGLCGPWQLVKNHCQRDK